jgi:hypothetical protein
MLGGAMAPACPPWLRQCSLGILFFQQQVQRPISKRTQVAWRKKPGTPLASSGTLQMVFIYIMHPAASFLIVVLIFREVKRAQL